MSYFSNILLKYESLHFCLKFYVSMFDSYKKVKLFCLHKYVYTLRYRYLPLPLRLYGNYTEEGSSVGSRSKGKSSNLDTAK